MMRGFGAFLADRRGNVAIIFGLALLPIMAMTGAAIDYTRGGQALSRLQAGTDAAALLLCKSSLSGSAAADAARATIAAYVPEAPVALDPPTITDNPRTVALTSRVSFETSFMRIMTPDPIPLTANAACSSAETFYEIALVLDTTGSMASSSGSVSKISALRSAATDFVNYMFDKVASGHLKIALVPFAASVKVDPATALAGAWVDTAGRSSLHWQNVAGAASAGFASRLDIFKVLAKKSSSWGWAGCFESLPYPYNVQDGKPSDATPDSFYVPLFAPDEVNVSTNSRLSSNNSYMDDGPSKTGSCDSDSGPDATRMAQACKYATPTNVRTSQSGPNWMCTSRALTRLTNNRSTLLNEISLLQANGNTDIHEGFMWGWRTLSPNSVFGDGAGYVPADPRIKTVKIVVLMTDGVNTWTTDSANAVTGSYYSSYGYFKNADGTTPAARLPAKVAVPTSDSTARAAMDALTRAACSNASQTGVTIYTVGFSVSTDPIDAAGQKLLADCAGSASRAYVANDANALKAAFADIANGLGQLRLTQ